MANVKTWTRFLFGALFVAAGVNHFVHPQIYVAIMPPYLPWHFALVIVSGVAEVALGTLLFVRRWMALAAWGLIALLVAVFPANIHMAMHPELYPAIPEVALWIRLPLQGVLIAWAYWYTRGAPANEAAAA